MTFTFCLFFTSVFDEELINTTNVMLCYATSMFKRVRRISSSFRTQIMVLGRYCPDLLGAVRAV